MTDEKYQSPFDERTALEELERLQQEIQQSRRRREQKVAEFDSFVRSFRKPDVAPPVSLPAAPLFDSASRASTTQPAAASSAAPEPVASAPEPGPTPPEPRARAPEPNAIAPEPRAPAPDSVFEPARRNVSTAPGHYVSVSDDPTFGKRSDDPAFGKIPDDIWPEPAGNPNRRRRPLHVVVVAAAAIAVVGLLLARPWRGPAPDASGAAQSVAAAPSPPVVAPAPAADPVPPPAVRLELVTIRPVWLRAVVDGERTIERVLPAGERIPLEADRTIVIRAGDAGAVQVTVAGRESEAFGPDAQPVTRTFAPEAR